MVLEIGMMGRKQGERMQQDKNNALIVLSNQWLVISEIFVIQDCSVVNPLPRTALQLIS